VTVDVLDLACNGLQWAGLGARLVMGDASPRHAIFLFKFSHQGHCYIVKSH
jgi:hypothetical protein